MGIAAPQVREVRDGEGILLASVFNWLGVGRGVYFVTPNELQQQVAVMNRPAGERIDPHTHLPVPRSLEGTQEVLIVFSGRIKTDIFDNKRRFITTLILGEGDVIILVSGGHGFEMIEDARFLEVKQGPYVPGGDKEVFEVGFPR